MTVAISTFGSIISPLFDMSQRVDLYRLEGGRASMKRQLPVGDLSVREKIQLLVSSKVHVLICGAISRYSQQSLLLEGIQVYPWTSGNSEEVLALLAARYGKPDGRVGQEGGPVFPVAIPAMGPDMNGVVASNPRSCRCLFLLCGEDMSWDIHELPAREWSSDSVQTVQAMVGAGARALFTPRCSPALLALLAVAGIEVILGASGTVRQVAEQYCRGDAPRAGNRTQDGVERKIIHENNL